MEHVQPVAETARTDGHRRVGRRHPRSLLVGFVTFDDGAGRHAACARWSASTAGCGPPVDADTDGPVRVPQDAGRRHAGRLQPVRAAASTSSTRPARPTAGRTTSGAVDEVSARTGPASSTTRAPPTTATSPAAAATPARADPVLIGWADEDEVDDLRRRRRRHRRPDRASRFGERLYFVSGSVVLDTEHHRPTSTTEPGGGERARRAAAPRARPPGRARPRRRRGRADVPRRPRPHRLRSRRPRRPRRPRRHPLSLA